MRELLDGKVFDLGSRPITVRVTESIPSNLLGQALTQKGQILLSPDMDDHATAQTLWHEFLHFIDEDLLGDVLHGEDPKHPVLDQVASAVHLVLWKNWPLIRTLYDNITEVA